MIVVCVVQQWPLSSMVDVCEEEWDENLLRNYWTCVVVWYFSAKELKYDMYLVPWAAVEQALLRIKMQEYGEAKDLLEAAK